MNELFRLLRYARSYIPALLASVVFMAVVGLSQGLLVRLIPLVFERVLNPTAADTPAVLFEYPPPDHSPSRPLTHPKIYITLNDVMPGIVRLPHVGRRFPRLGPQGPRPGLAGPARRPVPAVGGIRELPSMGRTPVEQLVLKICGSVF